MNGNSLAQLEAAVELRTLEWRAGKAGWKMLEEGGRRPENCGVHQKLAEGNASVLRQQLHHQNNKFSRNLETLGQLLKSALLIDVECCGFGYDIWYQNTTNSSSPRGRRW
uniref:HDC06900 n=1 Tax=Drosophila melanogaster TaxID=7227 RepID=Q6IG96_DROME|nr:TPA_inf: HDC06900 [Drosophila melanogaster]